MAEETTTKDLATTPLLAPKPAEPAPSPPTSGPATETLKRAPEAVKRSMPMGLSIAVGILLAGVLGWLVHYLVWFLLILYLSFVAATIMDAPVQWLKRIGMRRGMAAVLVMVGSLAIVLTLLYVLANSVYNQISAVSANLEKSPERINHFVNNILYAHFPALRDKLGEFDVAKELAASRPAMSTLWTHALWSIEIISWLVIMFFITLYMLIDGADHLKAGRRLLPRHARLESTKVFHEIARAHRGWALASLSNVCSASILIGAGLYFLGIPGAFLLGFVAGLGELIPNIGPIAGAIPAILFTLIAEPDKFFYVVGMFIVAQTIQSWTITPQMMKFSIELPVLVTILAVLVFGILFGFLGIIVAVPLVADMVVLWQYWNRYLEKDTTDYDAVNSVVYGRRTPMNPDNTRPSRLRKIFRRQDQRRNPPPDTPLPSGLDRLEHVERQSNGDKRS